jgi:transposase-like protein
MYSELAMSIVTLQLPDVKYCREKRPNRCPYCSGETFQRWGGAGKRVIDPRLGEVLVYRYRCCRCRRTFRHYPEGVDRARQTARMRALAAIGWIFGMSYRCSSRYLSAFGISLGRMSIWRDVQQRAEGLEQERFWKPVRVLGVDGAYVRGWGKTQPVLVAVDMGTGEPVTVGYVDEKDPQAVKKFLEPLMQRLGVSVIVTDDLSSYKQVAETLQLEHQICQFHVRRWVGQAVHELKESLPSEWIPVAEEVRQILRDLPVEGDKRLVALSRSFPASSWGRIGSEYTPVDKLRSLIVRLADNWVKFRVFDWQPDVPWTNNPTEQVIGKMKMRARTVRGYKNWSGMASGLMVAGIGVA